MLILEEVEEQDEGAAVEDDDWFSCLISCDSPTDSPDSLFPHHRSRADLGRWPRYLPR